jgi:pyruvate dehydrogenase (quinone)
MSKIASEYLVEALEKTGVKRVYGVVGDSLNGFTKAAHADAAKAFGSVSCSRM